jgi:hypothetical protein
MTCWVRYHIGMRRWLGISLAVLGLAAVPALQAQINGTRASVTSLGGSSIFPPGPPASVTSLGPRGFTPNFGFPNCCFPFGVKHHHPDGFLNGSRGRGGFGYGVLPLYSMPYYYGYGDVVNPVDDSMEQAYGPVSQRSDRGGAQQQQYNDDRLSRLEQQMDEVESATSTPKKSQADASEAPKPPADQPNTVLVFRDGHSMDVKNYAIVGDTLYDFSNGSRRKIALADLDLDATQKQNDNRGLDFRLPKRPSGN